MEVTWLPHAPSTCPDPGKTLSKAGQGQGPTAPSLALARCLPVLGTPALGTLVLLSVYSAKGPAAPDRGLASPMS